MCKVAVGVDHVPLHLGVEVEDKGGGHAGDGGVDEGDQDVAPLPPLLPAGGGRQGNGVPLDQGVEGHEEDEAEGDVGQVVVEVGALRVVRLRGARGGHVGAPALGHGAGAGEDCHGVKSTVDDGK